MDRDHVLAQLGAIRAICDALAATLLQEAGQSAAAGGCEHPEAMRQDASTLRGPRRFYCRQCKEVINEPV